MSTMRQRQSSPSGVKPGQVEKDQLIKEAEEKELTEGQKFVVPQFTVKQLLDAIPAHCFHRSAFRSTLYVIQDFTALAVLGYLALQIEPFLAKYNLAPVPYYAAKISLWITYQVIAGLFGTGIWIIGHEAGHQAYSSSKFINNFAGLILHSFLLVPYHSWRISHGRHHAATNHLTRDEVFVPRTREEQGYPSMKEEGEARGLNVTETRQEELREAIGDAPLAIFINLFIRQLLGWPMYLIDNASGQLHYPAGTNHFSPSSIIFKPSHKWQIILSDIGVSTTLAICGYWGYKRGFAEVVAMYLIPYLWVNHWLVLITFLQHTDPVLPHYSADKWTFARGALATIDRTFLGPIGAYVLHGICETHVAHHTSSKMPHYHAWEATEALKAFLGPHYMRSEENMLISFYKNYRDCRFIDAGEDVVFYKNARGIAKKVAVEETGGVSDSGLDMGESK